MRRSPWERALGERFGLLDAQLVGYFSRIPEGTIGRGEGVFDIVGTPRRWLWPLLAIAERTGIAFPRFERDVPFSVTNRSTTSGTVVAERTFRFADGDRIMHDEIGIGAGGLCDRLGRTGILEAALDAEVTDGSLTLRSSAAVLRLGGMRVPLGPLSPRVTLVEQADSGRQRVSLSVSLPVVGVVYEYSGMFTYLLEEQS